MFLSSPRARRRGTVLTAIIAAAALTLSACGSSNEAADATDDSATSVDAPADEPSAEPADEPADEPSTEEPVTEEPAESAAEPSDTATEAVEALDTLRIRHPQQLAFAAPFTLLDFDGALGEYANEIDIDQWASPDVLRGMLTSGQTDITAVPTYVGANLYNKGVDVRMLAVTVWGLLHVIGPEGTAADWESLRGQTVMVPFKNDMPDLVFQYLAKANGMTIGEDFSVEYYAQPPEVVAHLAAGTGQWAVLPEHTASLAIAKANQAGAQLARVLDLQEEWGEATGTQPRIPQAGLVVSGEFAAAHPGLLAAFLDELDTSVTGVNAADDAVVAQLAAANDLPEPVVASVIPRLNLEVVAADAARAELEAFYTELAALSPEIIGGQLPDDGFYLADPRQSN